jgi:hypothetical protein
MLLQHTYITCDTFLAQNAAKINKKRHNIKNKKYADIFFLHGYLFIYYTSAVTIEVK